MQKNEKTSSNSKVIKFFLPLAIAGLVILLLYLFVDSESSGKLFFLMFAYFFPPLGKESIIPIGVGGGPFNVPIINHHVEIHSINPLLMALTIAFVDIIIALFLVWNYDLAKKIPLVGKFMIKAENIGKGSSDKYSWFKSLRFIGIILFVMVPFQGSGGLVGSIVGRLFGMKPWTTFLAISIGAVTGCLIIAYSAKAILDAFKGYSLVVLIVVIVLIVAFMIYFYRKNKKNSKK